MVVILNFAARADHHMSFELHADVVIAQDASKLKTTTVEMGCADHLCFVFQPIDFASCNMHVESLYRNLPCGDQQKCLSIDS